MKKLLSILASVGLTATTGTSIVACGKNPNPPSSKTIELSKTTSEIYVNDSDKIQIKNAEQLSGIKVESSLPNIANVELNKDTKEITITGIEEGHTEITVSADRVKDVKISVTVNESAKTIELSKTTSEIYVNDSDKIQILNANQLSGIKVEIWGGSKIFDVKYEDQTNEITINGISQGKGYILVKTNEVDLKIIDVIVKDFETIELSKTISEIAVDDTDIVQILNGPDLNGINVQNDNPQVLAMNFNDQTNEITLTGISEGNATISIKANHAHDATINVTVNNLKIIELDKITSEFYVNKEDEIQILNPKELEELQVKSLNDKIATAFFDQNQTITIKGIEAGDTDIVVSAKNAEDVKISVRINGLKKINLNNYEVSPYKNKEATIQIQNLDELENIKVTSNDESVASATLDGANIIIKGIEVGDTTITVTAEDAETTTITVHIQALKKIQLSETDLKLYINEEKTVVIQNFDELINVKIENDNTKYIKAELTEDKIIIKGITETSGKITVLANNADPIEITVNVKFAKTIEIDPNLKEIEMKIGETKQVEILNASELTGIWVKNDNPYIRITLNEEKNIISILALYNSGFRTQIEVLADYAPPIGIGIRVLN